MALAKRIDLEHLDRMAGGDVSLRDEVLSIYQEQAEMWARMLDPRSDDSAWKEAAHALKGASRGVGAWEIGDICERAEGLIHEHRDVDAREALVDELRNAVSETVAEVRRLRAL